MPVISPHTYTTISYSNSFIGFLVGEVEVAVSDVEAVTVVDARGPGIDQRIVT
jgi:hypothetical protein